MPAFKDISNRRFTYLTAMEVSHRQNEKVYWKCICDCGATVFKRSENLCSQGVKTCGNKKCPFFLKLKSETSRTTLERNQAFINRYYHYYKKGATSRNYSFELTKEQFLDLILKDCFYSGHPPVEISLGRRTNGTLKVNGIDRVDNTKGYTLENSVPCCTTCNRMKLSWTKLQFFDHIRSILIHNKLF